MIVTIWRHGQADSAATDWERQLTGTGTDDAGFGCQQFHEVCTERGLPHPDMILHSSWVRTTQTADIIGAAFSHADRSPSVALIPGSGTVEVDRVLEEALSGDRCPGHVLLVSHQPLVSRLADYYLGDPGRVPPLSPGAFVSLELEYVAAGCAQLLFWALPPGFEAHV